MKKTNVKLYIHHQLYQHIEVDRKTRTPKKLLALFRIPLGFTEAAFYHTGLAVLYALRPLKKISRFAIRSGSVVVRAHADTGKEVVQAFRTREFRIGLAVFCLFLIVGVSMLQTGPAISYALQLKERVLGDADSGIASLAEAQGHLESQQVGLAQSKFAQAFQNFNDSKKQLNEAGILMSSLANILPQKREGENFITAAQEVSRAGIAITEAFAHIETLKFSALGITTSDGDTKKQLLALEANLKTASGAIIAARKLVESSDGQILPEAHRLRFVEAKEKILIAERSLFAAQDLVSILNAVLLGNKHVLLIMQNNNELRATGGFIGTFGALDLRDGNITALNISSIYDLDGQLTEKIIPPHPLYAINDRWYLRDSNWFAHFPDTAKKITAFYEKEGGESPDLIIGITPNIIVDLLALVGPIEMPRYGVTLTSDNFVELTQVATSVTYNRDLNQPKQLLADFVPILLQTLSTLKTEQYFRVLEIFQNNLNGKHIIMYSRDPALEARLDEYNWTGSLKESDRDYLSIVSSNLGGTKTDLYVDQKTHLASAIEPDGTIRNTLTITKSNPLPNQAQYKNTSFIRIYVPKDSVLESSQGFTFKALEVPPYAGARADDMVAEWEARLLKNVASGTVIGEEHNKTFFGNWLELAGGETKTITITYTLPYKIQNIDRYSLLVQKQAGAKEFGFTYRMEFPNHKLAWKSGAHATSLNHIIEQKLTVKKDEFFGFVFSKE